MSLKKNVASQTVSFLLLSTTDQSAVTAGSPTVYYTIDGGTQATGTGTITHEGNGEWSYVPAQAETNGDHVVFTMVLSGAYHCQRSFHPLDFSSTSDRIEVDVFSVSDDSTAANNLESAFDGTGYDLGGIDVSELNQIVDDWINGGRLDVLLDAIKAVTDALPDSGALNDLATLEGRLTNPRALLLDKLNISGSLVADADDLANITNNTRANIMCPKVMRVADSGSLTYKIRIGLFDTEGNAEAPDSAPTIAAEDESGNSRNTNLSSTTMSLLTTGRYEVTYTVPDTHDKEQVNFAITVVEGGQTRIYDTSTIIVDDVDVGFTASDRITLNGIDSKVDIVDGVVDSILVDTGTTIPSTLSSMDGKIDTIDGNVDSILVDTDSTIPGLITTVDTVVDAILVIANKLDDTLEDDAGTFRFTTNALEQAPSGTGGDASAANQTTIINHLTDIKGSGFNSGTDSLEDIKDGQTGSGVGTFSVPLTIKLGDSTLVPECDVIVTTANTSPDTNIHANQRSNANAQVTFNMDEGTYYLWRQKSGINFVNPKTLTIDSSGTATIS